MEPSTQVEMAEDLEPAVECSDEIEHPLPAISPRTMSLAVPMGHALRPFELQGFLGHVGNGLERRGRVEVEVQKERERVLEAKRLEREKRTAMFTTPGLRPLAEPPMLDWDWFFRTRIPSDLRYRALFPNDPEKIARFKDLHGELQALDEYLVCTEGMKLDPEINQERAEFYQSLAADLDGDWEEVNREFSGLYGLATDLAKFEFVYLDNDGKTTQLERWTETGANIFYGWSDEVREKYSHLVPQDFVEYPLVTFEFYYFDPAGGDLVIKGQLSQGYDILAGWPKEVQDKYGHLRSYLPRPRTPSTQSSST